MLLNTVYTVLHLCSVTELNMMDRCGSYFDKEYQCEWARSPCNQSLHQFFKCLILNK